MRLINGVFPLAFGLGLVPAQENYADWQFRDNLSVNTTATGADVPGNVLGFPLLIRLNSAHAALFSQARPGGADVRFSKTDGTHLPYQIEHWDSAGQSAAIWVKLDTVRGNNASQAFRVHWGRAGAADSSDGRAVFDTGNGFRAVWHFANSLADATVNGNNGTNNGTTDAAGLIGRGRGFRGTVNQTAGDQAATAADTLNAQYIKLGNPSSLNIDGDITLEAWVLWLRSNTDRAILSKTYVNGEHIKETYMRTTSVTSTGLSGTRYEVGTRIAATAPATNVQFRHSAIAAAGDSAQWVHVTAVYRDTIWRVYRNGVEGDLVSNNPVSQVNSGAQSTNGPWFIGGQIRPASTSTWNRWHYGDLDEVRVSKGARSPDWIKLSYEVQKTGSNAVVLAITPAPSNLSYAPNPAIYTVGAAIPPNLPTVTGTVTGYSVNPALPPGLSLSPATGVLSGTPTAAAAAANYTVTASNAQGSTTVALNIRVDAVPVAPSGLSYAVNPAVYGVGAAISPNNPIVTGTVTSYSVSPALPAGLTLNAGTGIISGTPTAAAAAANYTVTAGNSAGSTSTQLNLAVVTSPSGLSYSPPPAGYPVGLSITPLSPTVTGAVTSWSVSPALPAGLSLNTATGVITGTPTAVTPAANFTVTAGNAAGSVSAAVGIAVYGPPSGLQYSSSVATYPLGLAITNNAPAVTGTVTRFSVSPGLPAGLTLDTLTGILSGTPSGQPQGFVEYTVTASNGAGSVTTSLYISVSGGSAVLPGAPNTLLLRMPAGILLLKLPGKTREIRISIANLRGREIWSRTTAAEARELDWNGESALGETLSGGMYALRAVFLSSGKKPIGSWNGKFVNNP